MAQLIRARTRRAGDPGLNPGPGEKFSLKLLTYSAKLSEDFKEFGSDSEHPL